MESTVKFEGSVEKTTGIFKNKTKIWMVLEGLTLTYYKDHKKTFCVGSVDVTDIQTARLTGKKQRKVFEVTTRSTVYTFTAETDDLAEAWVLVIRESMLQKSPHSVPDTTMSSDYAQIADVAPVRGSSARSKIYEEIAEIQSSREHNIFGVKLRPSFIRANQLPVQSQILEEPEFNSESPSVSSFKPSTASTAKKQAKDETTAKPAEPIYAKPNKPVQPKLPCKQIQGKENGDKAEHKTIGKRMNKAPPSFSPPPPPSSLVKRSDKSPKGAKDPTYTQLVSDRVLPANNKKGKNEIPESPYAEVDSKSFEIPPHSFSSHPHPCKLTQQNEKSPEKVEILTKVEQVSEIVSPANGKKANSGAIESAYAEIDNEFLESLTTGEDISVEKEGNDDDHAYYLADSISRNPNGNKDTEVLEETEHEVQGGDNTQESGLNSEAEEKNQSKVVQEGTYDGIDLSQVVRRKRGSHVTVSFSEDAPAIENATKDMRKQSSSAEKRGNFSDKVDDELAESSYENIEVFTNTVENEEESTGESFEHSAYGEALSSVIGSMLNSMKENADTQDPQVNDEAFTKLKEYMINSSHGSFDLESHCVSCRNPVERLQSLLLS